MEILKSRIYEMKQTIPKEVNYEDKIVKLKDAITGLKDETISVEAKNKLLKSIIKRIEYEYISKEGFKNVVYKLHIFLLL